MSLRTHFRCSLRASSFIFLTQFLIATAHLIPTNAFGQPDIRRHQITIADPISNSQVYSVKSIVSADGNAIAVGDSDSSNWAIYFPGTSKYILLSCDGPEEFNRRIKELNNDPIKNYGDDPTRSGVVWLSRERTQQLNDEDEAGNSWDNYGRVEQDETEGFWQLGSDTAYCLEHLSYWRRGSAARRHGWEGISVNLAGRDTKRRAAKWEWRWRILGDGIPSTRSYLVTNVLSDDFYDGSVSNFVERKTWEAFDLQHDKSFPLPTPASPETLVSAIVSNDGLSVAYIYRSGFVYFQRQSDNGKWSDARTVEFPANFEHSDGEGICFFNNETWLGIYDSYDEFAWFWDLKTGQLVHKLTDGQSNDKFMIRVSENGERIFVFRQEEQAQGMFEVFGFESGIIQKLCSVRGVPVAARGKVGEKRMREHELFDAIASALTGDVSSLSHDGKWLLNAKDEDKSIAITAMSLDDFISEAVKIASTAEPEAAPPIMFDVSQIQHNIPDGDRDFYSIPNPIHVVDWGREVDGPYAWSADGRWLAAGPVLYDFHLGCAYDPEAWLDPIVDDRIGTKPDDWFFGGFDGSGKFAFFYGQDGYDFIFCSVGLTNQRPSVEALTHFDREFVESRDWYDLRGLRPLGCQDRGDARCVMMFERSVESGRQDVMHVLDVVGGQFELKGEPIESGWFEQFSVLKDGTRFYGVYEDNAEDRHYLTEFSVSESGLITKHDRIRLPESTNDDVWALSEPFDGIYKRYYDFERGERDRYVVEVWQHDSKRLTLDKKIVFPEDAWLNPIWSSGDRLFGHLGEQDIPEVLVAASPSGEVERICTLERNKQYVYDIIDHAGYLVGKVNEKTSVLFRVQPVIEPRARLEESKDQ